MSPDPTTEFVRAADPDLSSVRGSLLLLVQTGEISGLGIAAACLLRLRLNADGAGLTRIAAHIDECFHLLPDYSGNPKGLTGSGVRALDKLAEIESAIFGISLDSGGFAAEASLLIDALLAVVEPASEDHLIAQFDLDNETLEIFNIEAAELLSKIEAGLHALENDPSDTAALWEIRRSSHTFKGSAGILGMKAPAQIAHQLESVLEALVEHPDKVTAITIGFIRSCSEALSNMVLGRRVPEQNTTTAINELFQMVTDHLSSPSTQASSTLRRQESVGPLTSLSQRQDAPRPVVRVSVDRLDEIIDLSRSLLVNRSGLAECCDLDQIGEVVNMENLQRLLETSRELTEQIQQKVQQIRMIRFGTLQTRFLRAVNTTCSDLGKKADLVIVNGDTGIDTEMIDFLVEPMLHLLKNAVFHGVESPEQRRLFGKPDRGVITVSVILDHNSLVVSVNDDGAGIATDHLVQQAACRGIVADTADPLELVFERGLTTAPKVDLNAGRGVGMSIVRDCIEARSGTVSVASTPQRGTTITMRLPLLSTISNAQDRQPIDSESTANPSALVVDDSATIRSELAAMLKGAGFNVLVAIDGADALRKLRTAAVKPVIIFSDIEMPHVDGWSLLEGIKTDIDLLHIPMVVMTSLDLEVHKQMAYNLGAASFLQKPFTMAEVEKALAEVGVRAAA